MTKKRDEAPSPASPSPPSVSEAEWEVMKVFWEHGPMAARDVIASLPASRKWADKTVKTLLSRLVAKGALDYERVGNSYLYRAAFSRDELTRDEVRGFVQRVFDGAAAPLLAYFAEEETLSGEDLETLRRILDREGRAETAAERKNTR